MNEYEKRQQRFLEKLKAFRLMDDDFFSEYLAIDKPKAQSELSKN